jgi:hypothetical protein
MVMRKNIKAGYAIYNKVQYTTMLKKNIPYYIIKPVDFSNCSVSEQLRIL